MELRPSIEYDTNIRQSRKPWCHAGLSFGSRPEHKTHVNCLVYAAAVLAAVPLALKAGS